MIPVIKCICEACGRHFTSYRSNEEAISEYNRNFPKKQVHSLEELNAKCCVVCDECFKEFMNSTEC